MRQGYLFRTMFLGMIFFVIGISVLQWFVVLPTLLWPSITTVLLFLASYFPRFRNPVFRKVGVLLFLFFLGFTWATYQANRLMSQSLVAQNFGRKVTSVGWIASIPKKTSLGTQFQFRLKKLDNKKHVGLLSLSWYRHYKKLVVGDQWSFVLKLKRIHGLINPDAFDYQRWAFQRGIVAKGYVVQGEKKGVGRKFPVMRYRAELQTHIQSWVKDKNLSGVLTALTVGSKSLITTNAWQVFQRTGTSHLIAISGLHVALVAGIAYFLMCWVWRFFPNLLLYIPAQRAGAFFCCYHFVALWVV